MKRKGTLKDASLIQLELVNGELNSVRSLMRIQSEGEVEERKEVGTRCLCRAAQLTTLYRLGQVGTFGPGRTSGPFTAALSTRASRSSPLASIRSRRVFRCAAPFLCRLVIGYSYHDPRVAKWRAAAINPKR